MSVRGAGPIALVCLLMLAVSVVAGCGGGGRSEEEVAAERTRLSALLSSEIATQQRMAAVKAARADEASCRAQIGRALSQLAAEPQWLSKPDNLIIFFDTYRTTIDAIDTELGRIPRESLDKGCLRALGALTAVEETHKEVVQTWAQSASSNTSLATRSRTSGRTTSRLSVWVGRKPTSNSRPHRSLCVRSGRTPKSLPRRLLSCHAVSPR